MKAEWGRVGKKKSEKEAERTPISTQEPKTVQIYTRAFEILRIWTSPDWRKKQLIDFALQLHKCNHLFSTRENGTLESPYLPAGNSVTSPNHHQFLNEMDSTPVKQTNSFSRNTNGKILVCSLKGNDITNYINSKHSCQEFSLSIQIWNTNFVLAGQLTELSPAWVAWACADWNSALLSLRLTASISLVDSPGGLSDWSDWKVITQPFDLK